MPGRPGVGLPGSWCPVRASMRAGGGVQVWPSGSVSCGVPVSRCTGWDMHPGAGPRAHLPLLHLCIEPVDVGSVWSNSSS